MEKKGIVAEFKEFITRGNVMDMAVGIIIGGAFTAIVTSLEAAGIEEAAIRYGNFIQNIVSFLLIALVIFLMVKGMNKLRRKKEEPAPAPAPEPEPSEEVKLLTEIRDALKK